ncbi:MAG: hypothetical protein K6T75_00935 [Acetobacteraceae bacterium]|nr:hypothetical protein [Acetobacteraceae bacterium]
MEAVLGSVTGVLAAALLYAAFLSWQGDADIVLQVENAQPRNLTVSDGQARFELAVPLFNRGKQDGMVLEFLVRPGFVGQLKGRARIRAGAVWGEDDEGSGYWRAALLRRREALPARVFLEVQLHTGDPARDRLPAALPRIPLAIYFEFVGRKQIEWRLAELVLNPSDFVGVGAGT